MLVGAKKKVSGVFSFCPFSRSQHDIKQTDMKNEHDLFRLIEEAHFFNQEESAGETRFLTVAGHGLLRLLNFCSTRLN